MYGANNFQMKSALYSIKRVHEIRGNAFTVTTKSTLYLSALYRLIVLPTVAYLTNVCLLVMTASTATFSKYCDVMTAMVGWSPPCWPKPSPLGICLTIVMLSSFKLWTRRKATEAGSASEKRGTTWITKYFKSCSINCIIFLNILIRLFSFWILRWTYLIYPRVMKLKWCYLLLRVVHLRQV